VSTVPLSPELAEAVASLEEAFPGRVHIEDPDSGGVTIRIDDVPLSARWTPRVGQLWLVLPYHFPDAPIYPYYVFGAVPSAEPVPGLQAVGWRGTMTTQLSLRHNAWDPSRDSAIGCVLQAQEYLERI